MTDVVKDIEIEEKSRADSLADLTEDELRELKAAGKIVYRLMESKDGKYMRALDGTVYARFVSKRSGKINLRKVGHIDGQGKFHKLEEKLSKRERSKLKRQEKRARANV